MIDRVSLDMGYKSLKSKQKEVTMLFLQKKDVFVILPTTFGKRLCFGSLPLVFGCLKKGKSSIIVYNFPTSCFKKPDG